MIARYICALRGHKVSVPRELFSRVVGHKVEAVSGTCLRCHRFVSNPLSSAPVNRSQPWLVGISRRRTERTNGVLNERSPGS